MKNNTFRNLFTQKNETDELNETSTAANIVVRFNHTESMFQNQKAKSKQKLREFYAEGLHKKVPKQKELR